MAASLMKLFQCTDKWSKVDGIYCREYLPLYVDSLIKSGGPGDCYVYWIPEGKKMLIEANKGVCVMPIIGSTKMFVSSTPYIAEGPAFVTVLDWTNKIDESCRNLTTVSRIYEYPNKNLSTNQITLTNIDIEVLKSHINSNSDNWIYQDKGFHRSSTLDPSSALAKELDGYLEPDIIILDSEYLTSCERSFTGDYLIMISSGVWTLKFKNINAKTIVQLTLYPGTLILIDGIAILSSEEGGIIHSINCSDTFIDGYDVVDSDQTEPQSNTWAGYINAFMNSLFTN